MAGLKGLSILRDYRKTDLKTMCKVEDGSYNLYLDGVEVNPNTN